MFSERNLDSNLEIGFKGNPNIGSIVLNQFTKSEAFHDFESVEKYMEAWLPNMNDKDIVVTMGAGEAFKIGDNLLK